MRTVIPTLDEMKLLVAFTVVPFLVIPLVYVVSLVDIVTKVLGRFIGG
jgi:hypothetical protein